MPQRIDHIVIAVGDLDRASADYAAAGFTVTPGGEHIGGATHNALVCFADGAYFELIAIKDPTKAVGHRWFEQMQSEGAIDFALDAPCLSETAVRLADAGLSVDGPRSGGRKRPDGQQIDWQSLLLQTDPAIPLPFLIEDLTPRELRVPGGAAANHPLGAVAVTGLTIAVPDLDAAAAAFATVLGPATESGANQRFTVGSQWIDLTQGAGPASAILRIDLAGGKPQTLPAELTHGVEIRIGE